MESNRRWYARVAWHNLFYLVATPLGALLLMPNYFSTHGIEWGIWIFAMVYGIFTMLCITGGYHRFFAHRSYDAVPAVQAFILFCGAGAFQGSAMKWATDHRRHHRAVDTNDDPYNIQRGFWYAHLGWLCMEDNPKYAGQFASDLQRNKLVSFQDRHYVLLALAIGFGFPTLVGWFLGSAMGGFLIAGALRLVVTNHITFFINSLCHMVGRQPYTEENSARDSFIMAVLAFGEGYHNYHHKFQYDYRNGIRWYHWDPTKWVVGGLARFGWTYNLKRTPAAQILKARLQMEEKRLVEIGIPAEKLSPIREKVEEAQIRWRGLCEDYKRLKCNMQERSREKLLGMKAEVRRARRDFKSARVTWGAYTRHLRHTYAIQG